MGGNTRVNRHSYLPFGDFFLFFFAHLAGFTEHLPLLHLDHLSRMVENLSPGETHALASTASFFSFFRGAGGAALPPAAAPGLPGERRVGHLLPEQSAPAGGGTWGGSLGRLFVWVAFVYLFIISFAFIYLFIIYSSSFSFFFGGGVVVFFFLYVFFCFFWGGFFARKTKGTSSGCGSLVVWIGGLDLALSPWFLRR